jgi:CheY-like chemotaxis protein
MMGGRLTVTSEAGVGSTFIVTFAQEIGGPELIGEEAAENLRNFSATGERYSRKRKIVKKHMPHASVLVVDDVEMNLYVAKGMLAPYGMEIATAGSGFEALDLVKQGAVFDIVFMDHMMPKMDGMETTKRLREAGYVHPVVALTANAVAGQAEIFAENGFDGFISKPIDAVALDEVLNQFITASGEVIAAPKPRYNIAEDKLLSIFVRDAKKALPALEKALATSADISDDDLQLFKVHVHALKSSFAIIGEAESSELAASLEAAAKEGDQAFIRAQTPQLVEVLAKIIARIEATDSSASTDEDPNFLRQQMEIIRQACDDYDDQTAKAALKKLEKMSWSKETTELITKISQLLLQSEFELAAEAAKGQI